MYGYENKSGLLGSTVVGFVFYSSINVGVTIFYQVGERCRICIPITTTTVFNQSNFLKMMVLKVIVVDKIVVS
jgi:hypothetical protein